MIPDSDISASETHVNYVPAGARINSQAGWYTNDKSRSQDWIQVDLGEKKHVIKVATQVRNVLGVKLPLNGTESFMKYIIYMLIILMILLNLLCVFIKVSFVRTFFFRK